MIPIPQLLNSFLDDPTITDLCFNGHALLMIDRGAGFEEVQPPPFSGREEDYRQFILEQLSLSGRTWDAKHPFVDTVFFQTHRAHLAFPPVARSGICLSLRRLPVTSAVLQTHARMQSLERWTRSAQAFEILKASVQNHETVLFCGATGSGKTTLFNDLLGFIEPRERLIALEDTAEINPHHPNFLGLLSRPPNSDGYGGVTLRDLVRQTLRMKPDRILIGECRGDEVLDLLLALNTGHRGTLTTLHANSAHDALRRLELLGLIASKGQIPSPLIRSLISRGIQKIAYLEKSGGTRLIKEVISIEGIERDVIVARTVYPRDPALEGGELRLSPPREIETAYRR